MAKANFGLLKIGAIDEEKLATLNRRERGVINCRHIFCRPIRNLLIKCLYKPWVNIAHQYESCIVRPIELVEKVADILIFDIVDVTQSPG